MFGQRKQWECAALLHCLGHQAGGRNRSSVAKVILRSSMDRATLLTLNAAVLTCFKAILTCTKPL